MTTSPLPVPTTPASPGQWLRLAQVCQKTATGKSWVYERMKDEHDPFPRSVRIAPRLVVWDAAAVDAWMNRRLAQATENAPT